MGIARWPDVMYELPEAMSPQRLDEVEIVSVWGNSDPMGWSEIQKERRRRQTSGRHPRPLRMVLGGLLIEMGYRLTRF